MLCSIVMSNVDTSTLYIMNHLQLTLEKTESHSGTTPYSTKISVSTNTGHRFLALVDKHLPKDHKLRKIFNHLQSRSVKSA